MTDDTGQDRDALLRAIDAATASLVPELTERVERWENTLDVGADYTVRERYTFDINYRWFMVDCIVSVGRRRIIRMVEILRHALRVAPPLAARQRNFIDYVVGRQAAGIGWRRIARDTLRVSRSHRQVIWQ